MRVTVASNGAGRAAGFGAALVCVVALSACKTVQFDPQTLAGLQQVGTDSGTLYTGLQSTPPNCSFANNAGSFSTVNTDLASLQTHVNSIQGNSHTQKGVASLTDSFNQFHAADPGTSCLAPPLVQAQKSATDAALSALETYENQKPKAQ